MSIQTQLLRLGQELHTKQFEGTVNNLARDRLRKLSYLRKRKNLLGFRPIVLWSGLSDGPLSL